MKGNKPESTAGRREALKQGHALPPSKPGGRPGYPITDAKHWDKALQAVGRSGGGARRAALAKLLRRTAPEFGKSIKGTWVEKQLGGAAMSNGRSTVEYDLAARYRALNFADSTDETAEYGSDSAATSSHEVTHDHGGYGSHTHSFADQHPDNGSGYSHDNVKGRSGGSSGTSLDKSPSDLRTPTGGSEQQGAGFRAGSAGLNVRSRGGSYMSNGAGRGIELARRQVTTAGDIVVSRGAGGAAVIRHRRGGETIGTIQRLESGRWGGQLEGGTELTPHTHQRAALQELIGTLNRGQVSPFRPAMPIQEAPVTPPILQQLGVSNVRLATPVGGSSDGPRMTGSDSDSDDGGGPAGLGPKGVSIYKKLIARKFPPARALAFARRAENFGQKAAS